MSDVDDKVTSECAVCSTDIDVDDVIHTEYDSIVCNDCVQICQRCDSIGSVDDCFHMIDEDYLWCEACTERRAYWCEACESYNSTGTSYVTDRGEQWCQDCTDRGAYWCDDCDEYNSDGCDRCSDDNDSGRVIHDYSYRPDAIFHSTDKNERLYFGLEIEVEAGSRRVEASNYAQQLEVLDLAYLKNDGSLDNGFEIVTHPMSHSFFKQEASELWTVLEQLRTNSDYRVKSWDTRTCGLHIHISRTGFSGGAHMHRFLNLVYSNPEFYQTLAGRTSDQWAKFTDIYRRDYVRDREGNVMRDEWECAITQTVRQFKHKLDNRNGSDRYSAVNTNNRETLEMRIFRGSVNGDTIKAQLDLAHASVEYTRNLTVQDIQQGALSADLFMWYIFQHEDLYPELSARIDKLVVRLAEQNVSN